MSYTESITSKSQGIGRIYSDYGYTINAVSRKPLIAGMTMLIYTGEFEQRPVNPNAETIAAIEAARRGELFSCDSIESLFRDLDEED